MPSGGGEFVGNFSNGTHHEQHVVASGKCKPLGYDMGLEGTMYTNWYYQSNFCAANGQNGDGTLIYPTADGPVASLRLANIRAGIEDWELTNRLGYSTTLISNAADLLRQTVVNDTSRREDPVLLERLRRQAARRIIAAMAE